MSLRYQTILFDLDSTLIDNVASFRKTLPRVGQAYPILLGQEQLLFELLHHIPDGEAFFQGLCQRLSWEDAPAYPDFWRFYWDLYLKSTVCFPWTHAVLKELKEKGCALGMITNGDPDTQNAKIDAAGIRSYFDVILISQAVGFPKPDPRIYELALERLKGEKRNALFVGDNPKTDISGAKNAKIDSLFLTRGPDHYGATYVSTDIRKVLRLL